MEFLAPSFGPGYCGHSGSKPLDGSSLSLLLPFSFCLCQINVKYFLKIDKLLIFLYTQTHAQRRVVFILALPSPESDPETNDKGVDPVSFQEVTSGTQERKGRLLVTGTLLGMWSLILL